MLKAKRFDYKKAEQSARKLMECKKLQLIILGHQGAGKSFVVGTLGVKTLYLYGTRESHGPVSASTLGGDNVFPLCMDYGTWADEKEERHFTSDESMAMIEQVLKDYAWMREEKFGAIVIDGLPVLEGIAKDSTLWKEKCKTASGKHNTYRETESTQEVLGSMLGWLKAAQVELDVHVIATGIIDVKEKDGFGGVVEAVPRLAGYGLAETMNQHFADITCIGKMSMGGEVKYKFQFLVDLTKASKDLQGNLKKSMNFSPRISGCKDLPDIMNADLDELAAYKKAGGHVS